VKNKAQKGVVVEIENGREVSSHIPRHLLGINVPGVLLGVHDQVDACHTQLFHT
jgi:hypothetical protein